MDSCSEIVYYKMAMRRSVFFESRLNGCACNKKTSKDNRKTVVLEAGEILGEFISSTSACVVSFFVYSSARCVSLTSACVVTFSV